MLDSINPLPGLGEALRDARLARHQSLRNAASATGISASMLSQIENGRSWPSVKTLQSLAGHLSLSIDGLLGLPPGLSPAGAGRSDPRPPSMPIVVVQQRDHDPLVKIEGVMWRRLASDESTMVAPLIGTFEAGARSSLEGLVPRTDGSRYGCVLEGALTLILDDAAYVLRSGDSLAVPGRREQIYFNHTPVPARLLCYVIG